MIYLNISSRLCRRFASPYALKRFYPDLEECEMSGATVADVLHSIDARWPGLRDYLVEENGALRKHVNIFIGNRLIDDRRSLGDAVADTDEVYVMQALSGG